MLAVGYIIDYVYIVNGYVKPDIKSNMITVIYQMSRPIDFLTICSS